MKKSNILFYLTIVFAFALSGCISGNYLIEHETEQDISFRVVQTMGTRGVSRPIPDGEPLEFVHGDLYLVTSAGVIMRHFRIIPGDMPLNTNNNTVGRNLLTIGVTIESVPSSITHVVIIGNYGGTPSLTSTGNINSNHFLGKTLDITSQHNALEVNLTNCPTTQIGTGTSWRLNGDLYRTGTNNGVPVYSTTVHLAPTVARFEIADMTGMGAIASFTVDGIFMDGFYRQAKINGEPVGIPHTGGIIVDNFTGTSHTTGDILDTGFGVHDWREAVGGRNWTGTNITSLTVRPDNLPPADVFHPNEGTNGTLRPRYNTWSYHVFAENYHNAPATPDAGTPVPRIIIRLSNVRLLNGYEFNRPQFLTVRNFRHNGVPLEYIRASRVYRIEAGWLTFDEFDLSDYPNEKPIDVEVMVTLAVWREVSLDIII